MTRITARCDLDHGLIGGDLRAINRPSLVVLWFDTLLSWLGIKKGGLGHPFGCGHAAVCPQATS